MRILILCLFFGLSAQAQTWQVFSKGVFAPVNAACIFRDSLYIASISSGHNGQLHRLEQGQFKQVSDFHTLDHLLIESLNPYAGKLYMSGYFTYLDTVPNTFSIAAWNNTGWEEVSYGLTSANLPRIIDADTAFGKLFIGGPFTKVGGINATGFGAYDGNAWSVPGPALNGAINTLHYDNDRLWIGGDFSNAGKGLASWDDSLWHADSSLSNADGSPVFIHNLFSFKGTLYCKGSFDRVNGIPANGFAKIVNRVTDTVSWPALPTSAISEKGFLEQGDTLWVYGSSLNNNGPALFRLNQNTWIPESYNLSGSVMDMILYKDTLLAFGQINIPFTTPGNRYIAWFNKNQPQGVTPGQQLQHKPQIIPQPNNGHFRLQHLQQPVLAELTDMQGRILFQMEISPEQDISLNLPPGMYLLQLPGVHTMTVLPLWIYQP